MRVRVLSSFIAIALVPMSGYAWAVQERWVQRAKLVSGGPGSAPYFGGSVDTEDDLLLVGDSGDDCALLFRNDPTGWIIHHRLVAPPGETPDYFGVDVQLDGQTIVVGEPIDNDRAGNGSVHVYSLLQDQIQWTQTIEPPPGHSDFFGSQMVLEGDVLVVRGGRPLIFEHDGTAWKHEQTLDESGSYAIGGDYFLLGQSHYLDRRGRVLPYRRSSFSGWLLGSQLMGSLPRRPDDEFGKSVAISGRYAVVGAPGVGTKGAAFVFEVSGFNTWTEVAVLQPDAPASNFGCAVSIDGDVIVVGACGWGAYIYRRSQTGWNLVEHIGPEDVDDGYQLGYRVHVRGSSLAISQLYRVNNREHGALYVFEKACSADFDGDGDADVNDFFAYLDLFAAGDRRADFTGDGVIDVADFFAFLDAFTAGCD